MIILDKDGMKIPDNTGQTVTHVTPEEVTHYKTRRGRPKSLGEPVRKCVWLERPQMDTIERLAKDYGLTASEIVRWGIEELERRW